MPVLLPITLHKINDFFYPIDFLHLFYANALIAYQKTANVGWCARLLQPRQTIFRGGKAEDKAAKDAAKDAEKAAKDAEKAGITPTEEPLEVQAVVSVPSVESVDPKEQKKALKADEKEAKELAKAGGEVVAVVSVETIDPKAQKKADKAAANALKKEEKALAKANAAPQPQPIVEAVRRLFTTPRATLAGIVADNRNDERVCGHYTVNGVELYSTWTSKSATPPSFREIPCKTIN